MKLYDTNGYLDFEYVYKKMDKYPFCFVVGARGIGKTYGSLLYCLKHNIKFLYMRRTQQQLDMISFSEDSPIKAINNDTDFNVQPRKIGKQMLGFYNSKFNEDKQVDECYGQPIGYGCALSTIKNLRSFDMSDVKILIYDEFIGEEHERPIKNESSAFFNAIESISRNRELKGHKPLKVICLANANKLDNDLFIDLELVNNVYKSNEFYYDDKKRLMVIKPSQSPISQKKKDTSLYQLTEGTAFYNMAIKNDFEINDEQIKSCNVKEYDLIIKVSELCIYRHKSDDIYYVSFYQKDKPRYEYGKNEKDKALCKKMHRYLIGQYMLHNRMFFENYLCLSLYKKYFNLI